MRIHPQRIQPIITGLAILVATVLVLLLLSTFERTAFLRIFKAIWFIGGVASASLSFHHAFAKDGGPFFEVDEKAKRDEDKPLSDYTDSHGSGRGATSE